MRIFIYKLLIACCLAGLHFAASAQGHNNIWYFGYGAGVDFNSGSPVNISGGQTFTLEGSASVCNSAGQLLFYTDGTSVWDRNHAVMPNGTALLGNNSSTQSAVICPDPGSADRYYIFTADQGGYSGPNQGINYSIVDMTLNSGFGDVSVLNQLLMAPDATEKIVAVRHCNGSDFWIIVHKFNSDAFHAYQLSATGVNPVPVISNTGTAHSNISGSYGESIGYLKASPDGSMLALATYTQGFVEYFDFDNLTGAVSNPVTIPYATSGTGIDGPYGVSFSPDNTRLYVSFFNAFAPAYVYQYDLLAGNPAAVIASEFIVQSDMTGAFGFSAIQIGPDGKLYVCRLGVSALDVINFPNQPGAACGYTAGAVPLSGIAEGGLPNNVDAYTTQGGFLDIGADTVICGQGSVVLDASGITGTYLWSTGATTPTITVTQTGTYSVTVTSATCSGVATGEATVTFLTGGVSLGPDITTCNPSVVLDPGVPGAQYLWNTGSTASAITVTQPGTYSVTVTTGACSFSDAVDVDFATGGNFFPPNVFTPNGDGSNDFFTFGQLPVAGYSLAVYDRWGIPVFESTDPGQPWDGTFNGRDVPEGVYFWLASYGSCTGEVSSAQGFVELLRSR